MTKRKKNIPLDQILTRTTLRETAGPVYFSRGEGYFDQGAVRRVREQNGVINATVSGTRTYKTSLWVDEGRLDGQCSCPLGQDDQFCKHLVATGLVFIAQQKDTVKPGKRVKPIRLKDIEAHLSKKTTLELVHIIMEQADHDDEFYAMLKLLTASDSTRPNIAEMKRTLQQVISIDDYIAWNETYEYSQGIDRILDQLRTMLTPNHAVEVIELAEYAMDLWEENIEAIDDSDGCMGDIRDDLHRLHLDACMIAKPDPVVLAERLALRAISSEWEMFYDSYRTHRKIFGKSGCASYREIVEQEWEKLPHLGPGEEDAERYGRSSTLDHMMLAFAEGDHDLELAIRVIGRDLSHSYAYLRIAQRCRDSRKYTLAREWAEKGMAAFPDDPDLRLRIFLADEYVRAKRPDDAMSMIWANFRQRASLETYKDLAGYARKLKCWDRWREKAFLHLREEIKVGRTQFERKQTGRSTRGHASFRPWTPSPPDHSILVTILLWEKHENEAWEEAQKGGCSNSLWLDLAKRRENKHPEDAVEIYRRQVEPLIKQTKNNSYKQAIDFLGRIQGLMKRIGQEKKFRAELTRLKTEYKQKRNFIKFVEQKAWGK